MNYDIFNGDADGIISLLQLRLAQPKQAVLITGVKRDIELVGKVAAQKGDQLTILDISMEKNIAGVEKAISAGAQLFYVDHHKAGEVPNHPQLEAHIDLDANICTALIVDRLLQGQFHLWAITAAYGDNLVAKADALAIQAGLSEVQRTLLCELGTLINYNGYGEKLADLHFDPAELFQQLLKYSSPFDVIADAHSPYHGLKQAYEQDLHAAQAVLPKHQSEYFALIELPDTPASRRISGVLGNLLANQMPERAHAVLTRNPDLTYTVSLRAPLNNKQGAGDICGAFATGGGRAAAAGINALTEQELSNFIALVENYYS